MERLVAFCGKIEGLSEKSSELLSVTEPIKSHGAEPRTIKAAEIREGQVRMVRKLCLAFTIMCCLLVGCSTGSQSDQNRNPADQSAIDVSMISLIASPEEYDGKVVRVMGVGNLEFEGNCVYLHKEDFKVFNTRNGLWISLGPEATPYEEAVKYNGKYVLIEGTFHKDNNGHMGLWSGAIDDITRYQIWE